MKTRNCRRALPVDTHSREGGHWMVHDMTGTQRPSFHFASYCNWHEFPVASKARY